jgi:hypothetical protein
MDEYKLSRRQVSECMTTKLPHADGAYGRRHLPRGLWGYWNPPKRERLEKAVEEHKVMTHDQFIGFTIRKGGKG